MLYIYKSLSSFNTTQTSLCCNIGKTCCHYCNYCTAAEPSTLHVLSHPIRHLWICWHFHNRLNRACMLQTSVSAYVCVFNASYYASMLTPANRASLGEPLQTLSELLVSVVRPVSSRSPTFLIGRRCLNEIFRFFLLRPICQISITRSKRL